MSSSSPARTASTRNPFLDLAGGMLLTIGGIILFAGVVTGTSNLLLMGVGALVAVGGTGALAASGRSRAGLPPIGDGAPFDDEEVP